MARRTSRRIVKLADEPQIEAYRPPVPKPHGKLPRVHTSSTQRAQTMNPWFVMAVAVVAATIGALFGGLALHP